MQQKTQRLDELDLRLRRALTLKQERLNLRLQILQQRLAWQNPSASIQALQAKLQQQRQQLQRCIEQRLQNKAQLFSLQAARLQAYSPLATLERGYALVMDEKQQLIKRIQQVTAKDLIQIQLQDGVIRCQVVDKIQAPYKEG